MNLPIRILSNRLGGLLDSILGRTIANEFDPNEPRDERGRWTEGGGVPAGMKIATGQTLGSIESEDRSVLLHRQIGRGEGIRRLDWEEARKQLNRVPAQQGGYKHDLNKFVVQPRAATKFRPLNEAELKAQHEAELEQKRKEPSLFSWAHKKERLRARDLRARQKASLLAKPTMERQARVQAAQLKRQQWKERRAASIAAKPTAEREKILAEQKEHARLARQKYNERKAAERGKVPGHEVVENVYIRKLKEKLKNNPTPTTKDLGGGANGSYKLYFGGADQKTPDAVWKPDDEANLTCRRQLKLAVVLPSKRDEAAFKVSEFLGVESQPSVSLKIRNRQGTLGHWVPGEPKMRMANPDYTNLAEVGLFDIAIGNSDRHPGNWIMKEGGKIVPIDNAFSFPDVDYNEWAHRDRSYIGSNNSFPVRYLMREAAHTPQSLQRQRDLITRMTTPEFKRVISKIEKDYGFKHEMYTNTMARVQVLKTKVLPKLTDPASAALAWRSVHDTNFWPHYQGYPWGDARTTGPVEKKT